MKKQMLLLMAGGLLAFASCNSNNGNQASQAQIDSMVNVKVMEIQTQMAAKNDSIINALAQAKADSMMVANNTGAATSSSAPVRHHTTTTRSQDHTSTQTQVKQGGLNDRPGAVNSSTNSNTNSNAKKGSLSDRPGAH